MAKKDKLKDDKGEDKSKDNDELEPKGKKKKKRKAARGEAAPYSSIATHPKARASVKRIRAATGLLGFAVAAALSVKAQVPLDQVGLRALAAGTGGYMLAWWASMRVWRHLMIAEQQAAAEKIKQIRAERSEQAAARG